MTEKTPFTHKKIAHKKTPHLVVDNGPDHLLVEPSLFYDPPYERPLEDEFAWHLVKYLTPISGLLYQVKVTTACSNAWIDFVVEHGARRIGFEVGDLDPAVDAETLHYRDALVLGTGYLDVLYRFRGEDLMYRIHDALHLASKWDAELFSPRGRINLHTLASQEARACTPRPHDAEVRLAYVPEDDADMDLPHELVVRRLSRANPASWMNDYDQALGRFSDTGNAARWAKSA